MARISQSGLSRILIFRGGAIGDFILTLPALQGLRAAHPRAALDVVGSPRIGEVARACGLIDDLWDLAARRFAAYLAPEPAFPDAERNFVRAYDLIVSYVPDAEGALRVRFHQAGARQVITVASRVETGHASEAWIAPLRAAGVVGAETPVPSLTLPPVLAAMARRRLAWTGEARRIVALHPGSGGKRKNWPGASFVALAERLAAGGEWTPVFLIGEAEADLAPQLRPPAGRHPVLEGLSLLELAAILSQCGGYIGNDAGVTHLAAALGLPTLALFGPTDPAVWGPRGRRVAVLRSREPTTASLADLSVDEVWAAIQDRLLKSA